MDGTQMTLMDESPEYAAFVEKFKPKKTTDDCYTPPAIYQVVLDYVVERYGIDSEKVVRPFWPGGDYEREEYPDGCVVVDNPPFSILSRICSWYMVRGVKFFLFSPTLTILSSTGRANVMATNHIVTKCTITYENGATVPTSFVTNMETDGTVLESAPDLSDAIQAVDDELVKAGKTQLPKYVYPDEVITAAKVNWFCAHNTPYRLNARDCCFIGSLDAMGSKGIFGGGLLLSERAAAERAAAIRWPLSEREREMVRMLGERRESE